MIYYKDPVLGIYYKIIKKFRYGKCKRVLAKADKKMKEACGDILCPVMHLCTYNSYLLCFDESFIKRYWVKVDKIEAILLNLDKKFNERR